MHETTKKYFFAGLPEAEGLAVSVYNRVCQKLLCWLRLYVHRMCVIVRGRLVAIE